MAYVPQPDGSVAIVDDVSGLPVADGVPPAMLGSLYQPGAVAPPTGPDLRTAQLAVQNVGGPGGQLQGAPKPPGSEMVKDWFAPSVTQVPAKETPQQAAQALAGPAPAATPPPNPSGLPLSGREQSNTADFIRNEALKAMQPRGGVAVSRPERDVLKGFNVEVAPKTSEETKLAQELASVRQQSAAAESGMIQSASAEDQALMYEKRRQQAQAEIAGIRDQERQRDQVVGARMRELDMMGEELRSKRKGATNPDAYWEDKGELAHTLATIGTALYAAGGAIGGYDPMGLAKQIDAKIDRYNAAKRLEVELVGREIDEKRTQLGEVRKQFRSPEAAEQATRALMNEAMASETASMAEAYKSADAQAVAKGLIGQLQAQAADARAAAERAEHDAITQAWVHEQAMRGVVGGSPGGLAGLQKLSKMTGIPVLELARVAGGEGLPVTEEQLKIAGLNKQSGRSEAELKKYHEGGVIQLPEGGYGYTPYGNEEAAKTQNLVTNMPVLAANLRAMADRLRGVNTFDKLSSEDKEFIRTKASENAVLFKAAPKEALTVGELDALWNAMIGGDVGKIFRYGERAQLEQAAKNAENLDRTERQKLRKVPPGVDTGEPLVKPIPTVK